MIAPNKKKGILLSSVIAVLLVIILLLAELLLYNVFISQKKNKVSKDYIILENYIDHVINTNFNMLRGFNVYLETTNEFTEENVYQYLNLLLKGSDTFIRNVGIIEDTTIIWNYPPENNSMAIGTDLATIKDQRDGLLRVKEELVNIMLGPVDLVQGGTGFIIRVPFLRNEVYYGQISIVFDGDDFHGFINDLESQFGVNLNIKSETQTVYSKDYRADNRDLEFIMSNNFFSWAIAIQPDDGWSKSTIWYTVLPFAIFICAIWVAVKFYTVYMDSQLNKHGANHDSLTGLYNRHYLYKHSDSLFKIAKINQFNIGIIVIDIDHFKHINDTYGHKYGDDILINFSNKMKKELREGQEIFRIGGDEFVIVLENITDLDLLNSIALRFKHMMRTYEILEEFSLSISISVGTSIFPHDGDTLDLLYNIADQNMYKDKKNSY